MATSAQSTPIEVKSTGKDTLLLWAAFLLVAGGIALYYVLPSFLPVTSAWYIRVPAMLAVIALGLFAFYVSVPGKHIVKDYILGSRAELRKVVWPTRQETLQTTLIIGVVVMILGLASWGVDSLISFLIETLIQR